MPWTTLRLTVVTPLFSGDDPTSDQIDSPVRVPSIRGALRFWFRALAAGHGITHLPTLWAQEQAVFGSTSTPSPVALRIRRQPAATLERKPRWAMHPLPTGRGPDQRFRGAQYLLGQGLWNYQEGGVTRPFVAPGQSVELDLRFGDDETVNARFMLTLWAWLTYGGLGARTRRGFGQLRCTHVTGDDLPGAWTVRHLTAPATTQAWKDLAKCALPANLPGRAALGWPELATSQPDDTQDPPEFPALCPSWWAGVTMTGQYRSLAEALHEAGLELRVFRAADSRHPGELRADTRSPEWLNVIHGTDRRYPIAALGLPVGYYSPAKPGRAAVKATVDPRDDAGPLRRASPLWLRPVMLAGGTWTVFTHVFWARLLPPGARLEVSGHGARTLPVPDHKLVERAWDAWLCTKDRLPPNFYDGR